MKYYQAITPGILLVFLISLGAFSLGNLFPLIGGAVFAIILGIIISNKFGKPLSCQAGINFTAKKVLQWSIVLLGAGLSLNQVWETGRESFFVMIATLLAAFLSAFLLGKFLKVPWKMTSLIGAGTAICGGSAIAALSPIIEAEDNEIAYAISTIFLFNVLAVFLFPPLGHLLGFSDHAFGLWAGTAINDTSSVVAAGYVYSNTAGAYATIVKLTRTTMIIPISILAALYMFWQKGTSSSVKYDWKNIFPWFILAFLAASLANTLGIFSSSLVILFTNLGKYGIIMALAAVGLNVDLRKMLKTGVKPLILGCLVWIVVSLVSIAIQMLTGQI